MIIMFTSALTVLYYSRTGHYAFGSVSATSMLAVSSD